MAAVFDFLSAEDAERRARVIESLVLDGRALDARVATALKDIPYDRTIEEASTVTVVLIDPDGELLDSGLFSEAVDIELPAPSSVIPSGADLPVATDDPLGYRLVKIKTAGALLMLDFESREVALLRSHRSLRRASRSDVTRAEFIRSMVREVKVQTVRFWSPELRKRQPIAGVKDLPSAATKRDERAPGFGAATPTVKGKDADRAQIRLLEQALEAALSMRANERCLIGLVEGMTQESVVSNDKGNPQGGGNPGGIGGPLENVGVLHQDARYWPASRNVPRDVRPFITKLIPVEKANASKSIGWCVDQVQRSYSVGTSGQGKDYDQWEAEARETVSAYTGNADLTQGTVVASDYRKAYVFRRGEPGVGGHRETTWEASGRLAAEVNFRRFIDFGVFHYVSDDYLRKAAPRMVIERGNLPRGVISVDVGSFDTGQPRRTKAGVNIGGASVRVEVMADVLEPPLGGVWVLKGYGPCDGRYLITRVSGSYLKPRCSVTMELPVPVLPEPAPEVGTRATTETPEVKRSFSGGNLADAYDKAWEIHGKRYPYVWGGGHARVEVPDTGAAGTGHDELTDREHIGYDCSGSVGAVLKAGGFWPKDWGDSVPASGDFMAGWGLPGEGRYLTVWANAEHIFIEFKGMSGENKTEHFGTGRWGKDWSGPGFNPKLHPHAGFVARHWSGAKTKYSTKPTAPTGKPNLDTD